ncbi:transglycosylase domain-containing protein [Kineosporia sp. A_224]|uniref:penicillin-binding protein n=1 Tax=Kineosporia sp. A_224 TaxID=1962180 RepID=UPI000B4B4AA7|nr:transglycosylase domain-containing protein [Kineosporia sp. A_224]
MRSTSATAARALALLGSFVVVSVLVGALGAGLFLPAVGASAMATRSGVDYFNNLPTDFESPPLSQASKMYASDGKTIIATFFDENRVLTPLKSISPTMQTAIIAIEDSRFYEHGGIDPKGVVRAAVNNQFGSGTQGASTLTQQYIKNVNVERAVIANDDAAYKAAIERSSARKITEMRQAIALEKKISKNQVLENYLNIAFFGNNTYGVEAAARYYFRTSASKLNVEQSALLAGLVQSPTRYNPFRDAKLAQARRDTVLLRMLQLGKIDQAKYDKAKAIPLTKMLKRTPVRSGCVNASKQTHYFCAYVEKLIQIDPAFKALGKTEADRLNTLKRGGLKIYTTVDVKTQLAAWKAVNKYIPYNDKSRVATAAVTVEPGTGKVIAMTQNRIYSPDRKPSSTVLNYSVDKELGGSNGFQNGSTNKAFTLATWLKAGKSLYAYVDASQDVRPFSDFESCGSPLGGREPYSFGNAGDGVGSGSMSVVDATRNSVNTAYVDIESQLDLCDIAQTQMSLGMHLAFPQNVCGAKGAAVTSKIPACIPSLTLGPKEIAPLTLAAAYAGFAADGKYCAPRAITKITKRSNNKDVSVAVPGLACKQAFSEDVAHGVTFTLKRAFIDGTAARLGRQPFPAAGKTGTTNRSLDTWFAGYSKQRATAVWVGNPTIYESGRRKNLQGVTINGQGYRAVYGATLAGPIWAQIMRTAQAGLPDKDWPRPPSKMLRGESVGVPDVKGRSIGAARAILEGAGFKVSIGSPRDSKVPAGYVAETSPGAGSRSARGARVTIYPSTGRGGNDGGGNNGGGGGNNGGGGGGGNNRGGNGGGGNNGNNGNAVITNPAVTPVRPPGG